MCIIYNAWRFCWCTWHQKTSAKNSSKWKVLELWSEVNLIIQYILHSPPARHFNGLQRGLLRQGIAIHILFCCSLLKCLAHDHMFGFRNTACSQVTLYSEMVVWDVSTSSGGNKTVGTRNTCCSMELENNFAIINSSVILCVTTLFTIVIHLIEFCYRGNWICNVFNWGNVYFNLNCDGSSPGAGVKVSAPREGGACTRQLHYFVTPHSKSA